MPINIFASNYAMGDVNRMCIVDWMFSNDCFNKGAKTIGAKQEQAVLMLFAMVLCSVSRESDDLHRTCYQ
jgi:hypothetical protein